MVGKRPEDALLLGLPCDGAAPLQGARVGGPHDGDRPLPPLAFVPAPQVRLLPPPPFAIAAGLHRPSSKQSLPTQKKSLAV